MIHRGTSGYHLLIREMQNISPISSMFNGNSADAPVMVEVKQGVLIQVPGFGDLRSLELDIKVSMPWKYLIFIV